MRKLNEDKSNLAVLVVVALVAVVGLFRILNKSPSTTKVSTDLSNSAIGGQALRQLANARELSDCKVMTVGLNYKHPNTVCNVNNKQCVVVESVFVNEYKASSDGSCSGETQVQNRFSSMLNCDTYLFGNEWSEKRCNENDFMTFSNEPFAGNLKLRTYINVLCC